MRSRGSSRATPSAIVTVSDAIADEMRARNPKRAGRDDRERLGLRRLRRARAPAVRHASGSRTPGSFFGKRDPRPFLTALAASGLDDVVARFLGDFRSTDREWAEEQALGDRLELIPYAPRRRSLELQRDSEALLLLIPDAGGRGKGVLSGKVFEYLAAERPILAVVPPDGAAAELIRDAGAGVVVAPDDVDGMVAALRDLHARWRAGTLDRRAAVRGVARRRSRAARASRSSRGSWSGSHEKARRASSSSRASSASRSRRCTGTSPARSRSPTCSRCSSSPPSRSRRARLRVPRTTAILLGFFAAFLLVYLVGYFNLSDSRRARAVGEGPDEVADPLRLPRAAASSGSRGAGSTTSGARSAGSAPGSSSTRPTACCSCSTRGAAATSTRACSRRSPAAPARSTSTARSTARASIARTR